jgi:hypothetical protein
MGRSPRRETAKKREGAPLLFPRISRSIQPRFPSFSAAALRDGNEAQAHGWHLLVRREVGAPEQVQYTLSNAPETTTTQRLTFQQGQRYWVEQSLRNAESEAGMADYQLRLWQGWHHHMAMVLLAMLFMFEVRRDHIRRSCRCFPATTSWKCCGWFCREPMRATRRSFGSSKNDTGAARPRSILPTQNNDERR